MDILNEEIRDKLLEKMSREYENIHKDRTDIEDLLKEKVELKPRLWEEATGTVDQKKDYIRSRTSELDMKIHKLEADIEYSYNKIKVLEYYLVYCDE